MADDRSLPFEKRAYENYRSEMKDVRDVAVLVETRERDGIEDSRKPLGVDEERIITILLSFGGPCDGYKIVFDSYNHVFAGYYFFADWHEYKEFELTDEELERVLKIYPVSPRC